MSSLTLLERFRRSLPDLRGQSLCVAYSGGLDSTVLLHLLARLAPEAGFVLSALHVHHGLSAQADVWLEHCEAVCAGLGLPLRAVRVELERDGRGLEAAAREARHAAFAQTSADWVVLAHHADDQAETLLHRLIRGTGTLGAAAMRERSPGRRLWRPLLDETRQALLCWAQAQELVWIEDDSNADETLTRNFLRRQVMPRLRERFPAAPENFVRASRHFAEAADLLEELAQEDWRVLAMAQPGSRHRLRALSPARARNLLRYCLSRNAQFAPTTAQLEALLQALCGDAAVRVPVPGGALCAYRDRLWQESLDLPLPQPVCWQGERVLPWGAGELRFEPAAGCTALRLDPALETTFQFKPRAGGERLRLGADRPRRSLKQLCQEQGLPVWWREQLPMLWQGDRLLWIGGVGAAAGSRGAEGEAGWRVSWRAPDGVWR